MPTTISASPRVIKRFWTHVDKSRGMFACWPWTGRVDSAGYAHYGNGESFGGTSLAHRIAWMLTNGPIPEDRELDHVKARGCTMRRCVNVFWHLELVDHYENCRRGSQAQQTHCKWGHPLSGDNLLIQERKNGKGHTYRQCRTCVNRRAAEQTARGAAIATRSAS